MGFMEPVNAEAATQRSEQQQKLQEAAKILHWPLSRKSCAWQSRNQTLTSQNIDRWLKSARRDQAAQELLLPNALCTGGLLQGCITPRVWGGRTRP